MEAMKTLAFALFCIVISAGNALAALTGLGLPPLDMSGSQFGGFWASANSLVFTDLMKHSSGWSGGRRSSSGTGAWGWLSTNDVPWRPDGYPAALNPPSGSQYSVYVTIGAGKSFYKAGRYVVLYDGNGTLALEGDAASPPVSSAPGRQVVDITPNATSSEGLRVRILASTATNPLINIRIVPLQYEATYSTSQVFHPEFLELVQGVPLLRFTAWNKAISRIDDALTAPRNWSARTTPNHWSQVRDIDGVAIEHCVHLANAVNASMWISLPRAANDTDPYIVGMMSYIAANLYANLSLTVEYGKEGPGWLTTHLPINTKILSGIVRRVWADAGRPAKQLRVVMTAPGAVLLGNLLNAITQLKYNLSSFVDAIAFPASFGGMEYFGFNYPNPTSWGDPSYFNTFPNQPNLTLDTMLKRIRSSVITADLAYNKPYQLLRSMGIAMVGYGAGPQLIGPRYGSRTSYDMLWRACGGNVSFPCTLGTVYNPWNYNGGPSSVTFADRAAFNATFYGPLAANASREASLESLLRRAAAHDSIYDMVLDSLWRWHDQMGGDDVIVDVSRWALPCTSAPGYGTGIYAPEECRSPPAANVTGLPTSSPAYRALKTWLAAVAAGTGSASGALPRSSATASPPVPPPAVNCTPACVYGSCVNGTCVCWTGVSGPSCSVVPSTPGGTPSACNKRIGMNLEGIADWSRSWTFVDVFKASRAWIPQAFRNNAPWSTGEAINLTTRTDGPGGRTAVGYPAALGLDQRVSTLVLRDLQTHIPGGVYTVLYDGKGVLDFSMYDVVTVEFVEAGHCRVTFRPSTNMNNGILVTIERTDPTDPIRNIRVLMPGYEAAAIYGDQPFHPALLNYLRPFGLLRFMDWMHSNVADLPREWAERPTVDASSYATARGGVPVEYMVRLANMLGADPWFNMPYNASDDYVQQFAIAVRDSLRPDLKVYVEYSNELWHTGFPGGQFAQSMGLQMNLTEEGARWYGGATNEARLCFVGQRTANFSRIWKAAWGNRSSQVVVVVSGQGVWPITSSKLLSCGRAYENIDALVIAPYFGTYVASRDTNLTVFMEETIPSQINESLALVAQHAAIAKQYGKPLLTYESGQGMAGDGSETDMSIQANRDPRMAGLYETYLAGLAGYNVSRIVHFSSIGAFSKYGSWGLMEWMDQDRRDAPKYQGLMGYLNRSLSCPLPEPPSPASCPGNGCGGNGECLSDGRCMCYSGYSGADCSNVTYLEVYNCGYKCTFDQGWCNVSSINRFTRTWTCTCKPGISGLTCSINSCPNNCSSNGECPDQGLCVCFPGYNGTDCSTDCGCAGHGRCDGQGGCVCDVGWRKGASGKCDEWDCRGCTDGTSCIGPGECGCSETCRYGTCFHGTCRCWAGYGGPACDVSDATASVTTPPAISFVPRLNRGSLVGVNLGGLAYWSTEWTWLDLMKGSSDWWTSYADDTVVTNSFSLGVPLELRPDGYPARLPPTIIAHKLIMRNVQLHAWPGRYVVLWDGDGKLGFDFDTRVSSRSKNRMEIVFAPTSNPDCAATFAAYCGDNGMHLKLLATNPANPVRNIRILPLEVGDGGTRSAGGPGAGGAWEGRADRVPFHPWFLKSIARYRTIRFMGWVNTNQNDTWTNPSTAWATRTTPAHDTQARGDGAALEHIVQLCNIVGADPWVNVHHLANDDYVRSMATLLRDKLRPDVAVYVEHSNEVWNSLFPQYAYAVERGFALGLANRTSIAADARKAAYRYHALRTVQIGAIFKDVFSTAYGAGPARIKVVLGGWAFLCTNNTGCGAVTMKESLGWNGTAAKVDYYGVTGYWDCGLGSNGPQDVLLSVDDMVQKCNQSLAAAETSARALSTVAAPYGVPLITYEAGPSIVEASAIHSGHMTTGLANKFVALNRHPAMYELYRSYLEAFRRAGLFGAGRPWMQFVSTALPGQYGSWGMQEYTGQPTSEAHKYRSLMNWLDNQANLTGTAPEQSPLPRPLCMSLKAAAGGAAGGVSGTAGGGGVGLGEGVLAGPPAVALPAAGQVLVQGLTAAVRWATVGRPANTPVNITLWLDTDCASEPPSGTSQQTQQLPHNQAVAVLATSASSSPAGQLNWRVPLASELPSLAAAVAAVASETGTGAIRRNPRFFVRISDGVTTNYSEPFDILPPYVYSAGPWSSCNCTASPPVRRRDVTCINATSTATGAIFAATAATAATNSSNSSASSPSSLILGLGPQIAPRCDPFPNWNITRGSVPTDPNCNIDSYGCRSYRTSNLGYWSWSNFKPVTDCTAQSSPWPVLSEALALLPPPGSPPPTVALSYCSASMTVAAPAATMECAAGVCPFPPPSPPAPPPPPSPAPPAPPAQTPYCSLASTVQALAALTADVVPCNPSSSASQCRESYTCTAVNNCKVWSCNTTSQALVQISCSGQCQPVTPTTTAAKISDDGRSILISLSTRPAALTAVPCGKVFDATSAAALGGAGAALCSTAADGTATLVVRLPPNATIVAGQSLALRTSGSLLVSATDPSRAFTGSVTVSSCSSCAQPTAALSGPSTLSRTSCESVAGSVLSSATTRQATTFDASTSNDPSGRSRWASVTWSLPNGGPPGLQAAVERANGYLDISDRLVLNLTAAEEATLQDNAKYTFKVQVTSWLGTSASALTSFTRVASNPAPEVAVEGPAVRSFRLATGLRLAGVVAGGGCKGRTLTWTWTSPSGWLGVPIGGKPGQNLILRGPITSAVHGQTISLRVLATYDAISGSADSSDFADVTVRAEGSPPLASLVGPAGDLPDDTPLVLDATASSDPDSPSNAVLVYVWDCRREDHPTPCFTTSTQGDQSTTQGVWTIPAGLLANDRWHTLTVTVVKPVADGAPPLKASASLSLRPRSAALPFPRGALTRQCAAVACAAPHTTERDLTVLLQLASPYDTAATAATVTVTWSSAEAPDMSLLTAVTSATATNDNLPAGAFLLTIPNQLLPAARSSITLTAALTAASDGGTGSASLTVPLNGVPYCSLGTDATACLAVTVLDSTYGTASVLLKARGWADGTDADGADLRYEFGVRQVVGGSGSMAASVTTTATTTTTATISTTTTYLDLMQQRGASTSATLVGLPQGVAQLYGCAIDATGGRGCGRVTVKVDPPRSGFDPMAALSAINLTDLALAGDQRTILQAAYQVAQLAVAAANDTTVNGGSSGVELLLSKMSVALVDAMLSGGALTDPDQAPQAIAAIASLASSATFLSDAAKTAYVAAVQSALQTLPDSSSIIGRTTTTTTDSGDALTNFISQMCRILGAALPSNTSTSSSSTTAGRRRSVVEAEGHPTQAAKSAADSTALAEAQAGAEADAPHRRCLLAGTTPVPPDAATVEAARLRLLELLSAGDRMGNALGSQAVPRGPYLATGDGGVYVSAVAIAATAAGAKTVVQLSAGLHAVAGSAGGGAVITISYMSDVEAQLVLTGIAAAGAVGYGIDLQYAPGAAAGVQTALSAVLPAGVTILAGGLVTLTWNAGPGSAAVPPDLDGTNSYVELTIPAPDYIFARTVACLSYNVTTNTVAGNLRAVPPGGGAMTGVTVSPAYNFTTGRLTCRVSSLGSYIVAQADVLAPVISRGSAAGDNADNGSDGNNVGLIVGVVVGGTAGLLLLAGFVAFLLVNRALRRGPNGAKLPRTAPRTNCILPVQPTHSATVGTAAIATVAVRAASPGKAQFAGGPVDPAPLESPRSAPALCKKEKQREELTIAEGNEDTEAEPSPRPLPVKEETSGLGANGAAGGSRGGSATFPSPTLPNVGSRTGSKVGSGSGSGGV